MKVTKKTIMELHGLKDFDQARVAWLAMGKGTVEDIKNFGKKYFNRGVMGFCRIVEKEMEEMLANTNAMSTTDERAVLQTEGYRLALLDLKERLKTFEVKQPL